MSIPLTWTRAMIVFLSFPRSVPAERGVVSAVVTLRLLNWSLSGAGESTRTEQKFRPILRAPQTGGKRPGRPFGLWGGGAAFGGFLDWDGRATRGRRPAHRQSEKRGSIMRYRRLGRTGLHVSELCLGTMTFGGDGGIWSAIGDLGQAAVDEMVAKALAGGINFIDTADIYSSGASERLLGQALKNLGVKRSDVVVATKVFGQTGQGPNDRGASRGHIMDGVEASLERLGLDHIDLYQIHGNDPITPVEETLRALDDLVSQGLVRYVGCSNWAAWKIAKALGIADHRGQARFATVQAYYSIAGRDLEREIVPMAESEGVGVLVWSPLAGGLLSGKFGPGSNGPEGARRTAFDFPPVDRDRAWPCVAAMREIAEARGASVAQVALAYVLAKPFVTSVIIGARRLDQLEDNLAAAELALSADEMARLDAVSALPSEYPGWMLERQGGARAPQPFARNQAAQR
jgi:aryl-alcohol dehydrogenase-like predicted oxidoreductase